MCTSCLLECVYYEFNVLKWIQKITKSNSLQQEFPLPLLCYLVSSSTKSDYNPLEIVDRSQSNLCEQSLDIPKVHEAVLLAASLLLIKQNQSKGKQMK